MRTRFLSRHQGVTLVELMVMSVIASLVALTVIQGFSGISRGIISTRFKSIATQLAHERMQTLKSTPYYRLRVSSQTVVPAALSGLSPSVRSDATNYPPTDSVVSGVPFTNYTVVERVQKIAGTEALEVQAWDSPDTGLKQVTLDLVWRENGALKRIRLTGLLENPNRSVSSGDFIGKVTNVALTPIVDATVEIEANTSLSDTTDGGGNYRIGVPAGTYALRASKFGFFTKTSGYKTISSTAPQVTVDFLLSYMSSGTISGSVWQNDHLVISRVCGAKMDGTNSQEYVEIFNPTTWTWTVDGQVGLTFQRQLAQDPLPVPIAINYAVGGANIAPGGFYLFASTPILNINGTLVNADAVWESAVNGPNDLNFPYFDALAGKFNILPINTVDGASEGAGVLTLTGPSFDRVGWKGGGGATPAFSETNPVPDNAGLELNEIYFRKCDVGGAFSSALGPAYDSGDNSLDWGVDQTGGNTPPRSTASPALPVRSGTPSHGAFVFADDGFSQMVQASLAGSPPEARFTLPAIATGTWTVATSSGNYFLSFSTTITAGVSISTSVVMTTTTVYGFVSGRVLNSLTNAGIAGIAVSPGGGVTNAGGNFNVALSPGNQTVTANPGGANASYMTDSKPITVTQGQLSSNNYFYLGSASKIRGRVTIDGTNPLPDVPIEVSNIVTGYVADNVTSGADGNFTIAVPTGTYSVRPTTAYGETVTPVIGNLVAATSAGVFSATFTVTSAYGTLAGSVSSGTNAITTGVLIIASTAAIPASPPDIDNAFRGGNTLFYAGCSRPDGTYSFDLKNGSYFVAGWFTTFNGTTPTVTRVDQAAVLVQPRQKTVLNLSW